MFAPGMRSVMLLLNFLLLTSFTLAKTVDDNDDSKNEVTVVSVVTATTSDRSVFTIGATRTLPTVIIDGATLSLGEKSIIVIVTPTPSSYMIDARKEQIEDQELTDSGDDAQGEGSNDQARHEIYKGDHGKRSEKDDPHGMGPWNDWNPWSSSTDPTTTSDNPTTTSDDPTTTSDDPTTTSDDPTTTSDDPTTTSSDPTTTSNDSTTTTTTTSTITTTTSPTMTITTTTTNFCGGTASPTGSQGSPCQLPNFSSCAYYAAGCSTGLACDVPAGQGSDGTCQSCIAANGLCGANADCCASSCSVPSGQTYGYCVASSTTTTTTTSTSTTTMTVTTTSDASSSSTTTTGTTSSTTSTVTSSTSSSSTSSTSSSTTAPSTTTTSTEPSTTTTTTLASSSTTTGTTTTTTEEASGTAVYLYARNTNHPYGHPPIPSHQMQ